MAKESDMSIFSDVLEPFRRVINTDPPKDKLSASDKLDFSGNSQSLKEGITKLLAGVKRKASIGANDATPDKRNRSDLKSSTSAVPVSPWETRRMKADLIAAKAQIIKLESRVNQQHTLRSEMQILFDEEKGSLQDQHKRDERALSEMQDRLQLIRRREHELRDEFNEAVKEHKEAKIKWDQEKTELVKQIGLLKDNLLEANVSSKDQISEMKKDMDELLQAFEGAQAEVDMLKKEVAKQTTKAELYVQTRAQLDKQSLELHQVTSKLRELESERDSYKDWQQHSKTAQKRLSTMAELEKEVIRLRATERHIRDAITNKLLLEEQVHTLGAKVEALQPAQQALCDAKVKIASLESSLEEWVSAARAHGVESARMLSQTLESALSSQLTAAVDSSQRSSQVAQLQEELLTLKYERDKVTAKLNDLMTVRKNQESLIHRLQKRLLLVTRERDSYRQQLDAYETELSVTLCGETGVGSTALLNARVQQLEKSLQGYRDLLANQEPQQNAAEMEKLRNEASTCREEAASLRREVVKLRTQRDRLQTQLEGLHRPAAKVLHLSDNPAAAAHKQVQVDLEAAQEEIKRLKEALREGGGAKTSSEDEQKLKQQLENSRIKLQRMKEEFTSSAQEYRDVCYMLLGYKIDRTGHKNYRISNMYAESSDEYLTFTLCDEGIEMVHTEYSTTLGDLVELHLHQHHSIPVFLSALTMELFTRTTIQPQGEEDEENDDDSDDDDDEDDEEEDDE